MRPVSIVLLIGLAFAQPLPPVGREALQQAHGNWRQADPGLERDVTSAGATLGARADKAAAEGAKYFAARRVYLESLATDADKKAAAIEPLNVAPDTAVGMEAYLSKQNTLLGSSIDTIAREPDRAIQQLRQALERERAAIAAISAAAQDVQKTQEAVVQTSINAERERAPALEHYQKLAAILKLSAQLNEQSGAAWANYYRALSDAARSVPAPVTSLGPGTPATPRPLNPSEPARAPLTNPASATTPRSITPVPLSRFVGSWIYPTVGAHYHGAQPESVELVVHEENGRASGTLYARFRLPFGQASDPVVRFTFEGAFENSRTQKFAIATTSGAPGTMELIPGPAFNLLEVNFSTYDKPAMIRQANFLLIKK